MCWQLQEPVKTEVTAATVHYPPRTVQVINKRQLLIQRALLWMREMRLPRSRNTSVCPVFNSLIARCSNLSHIHQTHAFMIPRALDQDTFFLSHFIAASSSLGFSDYAYSVFASVSQPHIFLYNTLIKALSSSSSPPDHKAAIFLFNHIQLADLRPDSYSFPFALKAVLKLSAFQTGRQLHCQTIPLALASHPDVVTALIQMYSFSFISDARKLFDEMSPEGSTMSLPLWNAMLSVYAKAADLHNARHLFQRMPQKNAISWTTMITAYVHCNRPHHAISSFRAMLIENVEPDQISLLVALSACAQLGALHLGYWIHNYILKRELTTYPSLNNALIDMYAKCGKIHKALQVFENTKHKTIVTWTTMIAGLALHGLGREALHMYSRMETAKVEPNEVTFLAILSACSHAGLLGIARFYFDSMSSKHGIEPNIEHYGCMIHLLGRTGYLKEAQELLARMPFEANAAIWGSILSASSIRGDAKLAELALCHLVKLEPNNSGNYSLLSNTYCSLGRWKESRMVRKAMRDTGVKKMPGGSFIEVNNKLHEFISGGASHPQSDRIFEALCDIDKQLRMSEVLQNEWYKLLKLDNY